MSDGPARTDPPTPTPEPELEPPSTEPEPEPEPATEPATEPDPPEPELQPPSTELEPPSPGSGARSLGLLLAAFGGSLIVLLGLAVLAGQAGLGGPFARPTTTTAATGTPAATATPAGTAPSAVPTLAGPPLVPTPAPGEAILVGAGDIATCGSDGDETTAALLDRIPGTVFTAGDNAYDTGSLDEFERCYAPSWGRHEARTRPAPGNHDYGTDDAAGYRDYFGPDATPDGTTWYAYDLGGWHVVVLDSDCGELDGGCDPDGDQVAWLRDDLEASDARCTLAIWHHPRFSSGDEHGDDPSVGPFWDVLHAAGAEVVVNGHDHDYERFAPQDAAGVADPARGIREFVVGTGGAPLRGFDDPRPNSQVRSATSHGVLVLTLRAGGYGWRFVSTDGVFSDQGSGTCHA